MKKLVLGGLGAVVVFAGVAALIWQTYIYRDPALWKVDLYQAHNGWDLICDRYEGTKERRCYLRYVDTYSQDPFGAAVFFIQHHSEEGTQLSVDLEKDNHVISSAFQKSDNEEETKLFSHCISNSCVLDKEKTGQFMMLAARADLWLLSIQEANGNSRRLELDVSTFANAERNFVTELKKRGLF